MAIQAPIRKEITEYKSKLFFGLSGRQLLFSVLGLCLGIGSYILLNKVLGTEFAGYVVIALVAPLFAIGFIKIDGEPFERYLIKLYKYSFYPKARVYGTYMRYSQNESLPVKKNKEQKNAQKEKRNTLYGLDRETLISEYDYKARQRENKTAYRHLK